ncbi:MAG: hypothetical protein JSS74_00415 [Actinobacteria bacterium]|nr:hypothetical protein [Actinomycetota bacterium]
MSEPTSAVGAARATVDQIQQTLPPPVLIRPSSDSNRMWRLEETVRYLGDYIDYLERRIAALEARTDQT